jgi:AcrR family transcriptional regulator
MPVLTMPRMAVSTGLVIGVLLIALVRKRSAVWRSGLVSGAAFGLIVPAADYVYTANMAKNGNTVNIESSDERYHHGDLRKALVEKGLERLAEGPADALSLREIARSVGVSATAVYRHFPDKAALLTELCREGDRMLAETFRKAMAKVKPGQEAFDEMGRAYVRFALAHPALFRLMMSPAGERRAEGEAGEMLVEALRGLSGPDLTQAQRDVQRLKAWSMVHGLAMLMLDGLVPANRALIDQVIAADFLPTKKRKS